MKIMNSSFFRNKEHHIKVLFAFFFVLQMFNFSHAQSLSQQEAVASALANHPSMQIADMEVQMQMAMERSAFNPEQPELAFEFPNDVGLVFDVRQTLDFPTVYSARRNWLKAQTFEQEQFAGITRHELIKDVRLAYLNTQVSLARAEVLAVQDSLWASMDSISQRLFTGGHINKADALYSSKQAGLLHQLYRDALAREQNARYALQAYTGLNVQSVDPLQRLTFSITDSSSPYYFEPYVEAKKNTASRELNVHNAERLPDLIVGFLRVPEVETEYRNRFNAGLTIPIWRGQYRAEVDRIRIAIDKAQAEAELWKRNNDVLKQQLIRTWMQTSESLDWYENEGLPQSGELVSAYQRLYGGGEVDYALTLRNIADAVDIHLSYLEMLQQHNEAVIELQYLFGK